MVIITLTDIFLIVMKTVLEDMTKYSDWMSKDVYLVTVINNRNSFPAHCVTVTLLKHLST